jgi:hypothetical protein
MSFDPETQRQIADEFEKEEVEPECTCRLACFECRSSGDWHVHNTPCSDHPGTPIQVMKS